MAKVALRFRCAKQKKNLEWLSKINKDSKVRLRNWHAMSQNKICIGVSLYNSIVSLPEVTFLQTKARCHQFEEFFTVWPTCIANIPIVLGFQLLLESLIAFQIGKFMSILNLNFSKYANSLSLYNLRRGNVSNFSCHSHRLSATFIL